MKKRAWINTSIAPLLTKPHLSSTLGDEVLLGTEVKIIQDLDPLWVKVQTFYRYEGYLLKEHLAYEESTSTWLKKPKAMVLQNYADILSLPKVQGAIIINCPKGSLVAVENEEEDLWIKVTLPDNRQGWIRKDFLGAAPWLLPQERSPFFLAYPYEEKCCSYLHLPSDPKKYFTSSPLESLPLRPFQSPNALEEDHSITSWKQQEKNLLWARENEAIFRNHVVRSTLSYLGTQYRWGGKTPLGIDCSGLCSMAYMLNGILIYRDADIKEGFPVREIPLEQVQKGDLLFFPGHVAMYIEDGRYIHSSAGIDGVGFNSLNPKHQDYRESLAQILTGVGSIF